MPENNPNPSITRTAEEVAAVIREQLLTEFKKEAESSEEKTTKKFEDLLDKAIKKSQEETERQVANELEKNRDELFDLVKKFTESVGKVMPTINDDWHTEKDDDGKYNVVEFKGTTKSLYERNGYMYSKAITVTSDAPGAPVESGRIWTPQTGGNPFRQDVFIQPVTGGAFKVISLGEFSFQTRANTGTAFTDTTTSSETEATIGMHDLLHKLSLVADDDVPSYFPAIEAAIMLAETKKKGADIFSTISTSVKSSTTGTLAEVATGVADNLPTAANILGKLADMTAEIDSDYRDGAVWHMSTTAYARVLQASSGSGGEWVWNPAMGNYMLFGYPVRVNDRCQAGTTANDVSVLFGNFFLGVTLGERVDLEIGANPYTNPGTLTFYARTRFKEVLTDTNAIVGLTTKT